MKLPEAFQILESKAKRSERIDVTEIRAALQQDLAFVRRDAAEILRDVAAAYQVRAVEALTRARLAGRPRDQLLKSEADEQEAIKAVWDLALTSAAELDATEAQARANRDRVSGSGQATTSSPSKSRLGQELKALMVGIDPSGGYLDIAARYPEVWKGLTPLTAFLESGVQQFTTDREAFEWPAVTSDPAAAWTAEAGTVSATQPAFGVKRVSLYKAALAVPYTQELADDTNVSQIIETLAMRAIGKTIDTAAFGTQAGPYGLPNWVIAANSFAIATNGAVPSNFDFIAEALTRLLENNAIGKPVIVMHPSTWKVLLKVKEVSGSTKPTLMETAGGIGQAVQRQIYGAPVFLSNQLSLTEAEGSSGTVCNSVWVYDPTLLCLVRHVKGLVFLRDPYSSAATGVQYLRAYLRVGIGVLEDAGLIRVRGIKLS